jgi:hypothetical protein
MNGKEFAEWMEEVGISLSEAASLFGVSEQTLYNWRSTVGVPDRKLEWVRARMAAHVQKQAARSVLDRLVIEVTDDQLRAYLDAASHEGLYVKDWARQVLDEAAHADHTGSNAASHPLSSLPELKVADDPGDYTPKKEMGA